MARFALRAASPLIWGNRGLLIQLILDKINGKLRPPPPPPLSPNIKDGKMARFCPSRGSILDFGGWGFAVPFYSVQDCGLNCFGPI